MSDAANMGKQAISKLAEIGLKTQLDECDELTLEVQASPDNLAKGEVTSVTIEGQGLAMQSDELRTANLHIETGAIAITPWKAAFGNIELKQTVEAQAEITLSEQDIDCAFNSDDLRHKLKALPVQIEGETTPIIPHHIEFSLPGEGRAVVQADIETVNSGRQYSVTFTATPQISPDSRRIILEAITYEKEANVFDEVTAALAERAAALLDMSNFELEGMHLQIRELTVLTGKLKIQLDASVDEFPGG